LKIEPINRLEGESPAVTAESVLRLSVKRLSAVRRPGGYYEGFSDAGVAFDAANLLLSRFVGEKWPEDPARVMAKTRHLLSGQHASGLFRLYPEGPCSVEATRIVCLAIDCALAATGSAFPASYRDELSCARRAAEDAVRRRDAPHFELAFLVFFRLMLQALNDNAPDRPRFLPDPSLVFLLPVMLAGLLPNTMWRRANRVLYPFIAVLPQLLCFAAWRAVETSEAGARLTSALDRLPGFFGQIRRRMGRGAAHWLLSRQDSTGGFYYSVPYTCLFVAALRNAVDSANDPPLEEQAAAAVRRALDYVRGRETGVPTGISSSFLASDVWDTTAVATAFLEAPPDFALPEASLEELCNYVVAQQSPSGGFSYGRGSQFPDVDSTGLAIGLLASIILRNPAGSNRTAMLAALVKAFDFLEKHRSAQGGFNAWTIRHGETPPPMPSELTTLLFDVSSPDVTGRVMSSLARVVELARADAGSARALTPERLHKIERLRSGGLKYLQSTRNASTGLWPARWTLGYIIGTRFVFDALDTYPEVASELPVLREAAARTLLACQNADGGFGESPDSDTKGHFTPSSSSAALVTAAALGILRDSQWPRAREGASRALAFILNAQRPNGAWTELSLCTQFAGLYASYELMTQIALTTTLFRVLRSAAR
jgi:Squalene-hopene cyclase C-terminal domain/Prenyltransferase and squalene oxidase repeat